MRFAFDNKTGKTVSPGRIPPGLCDQVDQQIPGARLIYFAKRPHDGLAYSRSCMHMRLSLMLFYESRRNREAIDELPPKELTKLAAYIARRDKLTWDKELEEDFVPGGKHEKALEKIDAEIDSGNFTPLP